MRHAAAALLAVVALAWSGAAAAAQAYVYLAFSDGWSPSHVRDILSVPGFVSARPYEIDAARQLRTDPHPKPHYLVVYRFSADDLAAVRAAVAAKETAPVQSFTYRLMAPAVLGVGGDVPGATGAVEDYMQMVFVDPVPGQAAGLNDWYDNHHLGELTANPGLLSGERGELAPIQIGEPPHPSRYVSLFAFHTANFDAFARALHTATPNPPAFDQSKAYRYTLRAVGPLIEAPRHGL